MGENARKQEETFMGDASLTYLDCGDGFTGVHSQDISNCTF